MLASRTPASSSLTKCISVDVCCHSGSNCHYITQRITRRITRLVTRRVTHHITHR